MGEVQVHPLMTPWSQFLVKLSSFYLGVLAMTPALSWSAVPSIMIDFPGSEGTGSCKKYYPHAPAIMVFFFAGATLLVLTITLVRVAQKSFPAGLRFWIGFVTGIISVLLPIFAAWIPYSNSCVGIGVIVVSEVIGGISCAVLQSASMAAAVPYGPKAAGAVVVGLAGVCIVSIIQSSTAVILGVWLSLSWVITVYFGSIVVMYLIAIAAWNYLMEPTRRQLAEELDQASHIDAKPLNQSGSNGAVQSFPRSNSQGTSLTAPVDARRRSEPEWRPLLEDGNGQCHVDHNNSWGGGASMDAPCADPVEGGMAAVFRGLWEAIKPARKIAIAMYLVWVASMAVYPGQLSGLHSPFYYEDNPKKTELAKSLFLTGAIGIWGCVDCVARAFTPVGKPQWTIPVLITCVLRFFPLAILVITVCPQIIKSQIVPIIIAVFGGATNGSITSLCFSIGISSSAHHLHDLTASALSFVLMLGNTSGTLLSLIFGTIQTSLCPAATAVAMTHTPVHHPMPMAPHPAAPMHPVVPVHVAPVSPVHGHLAQHTPTPHHAPVLHPAATKIPVMPSAPVANASAAAALG